MCIRDRYGVLSPLIARPRPEGGYEIISGHRRQHAAPLAGLDALPVIVRNMDDDAAVDVYKRQILGDLFYLVVGVQVVGQQAAAKAGQMLQHRAANAARTDPVSYTHLHRGGPHGA